MRRTPQFTANPVGRWLLLDRAKTRQSDDLVAPRGDAALGGSAAPIAFSAMLYRDLMVARGGIEQHACR